MHVFLVVKSNYLHSMRKRLAYEVPEVGLILVRFEENVLLSGKENVHSLQFSDDGGAGKEFNYQEIDGDF